MATRTVTEPYSLSELRTLPGAEALLRHVPGGLAAVSRRVLDVNRQGDARRLAEMRRATQARQTRG